MRVEGLGLGFRKSGELMCLYGLVMRRVDINNEWREMGRVIYRTEQIAD